MDDFYRYYAPDFNFLYPKSVFAYSEADDETNSYYLSSADGSMTLEFYEEDTSGSAKENVKKFYNKTQNEVHAIKYDPKWEDHQVIAGQYVANTNEAFYYFIRNENAKNYIFKFHYVDPDLNNDYNQEDYIMETIYRGCSFSKASKPRSFRNFEDEGKVYLFFDSFCFSLLQYIFLADGIFVGFLCIYFCVFDYSWNLPAI